MPVEVSIEGGGLSDTGTVEADAARLLDALGLAEAELSVVLADDAFVASLNAEWRGVHDATDVLSFRQETAVTPGQFASAPAVLGDVVISTETAARQAAELGHALEVEIRVLLVHGLLHLVGHDHEVSAAAARNMRAEEARLAAVLGIDPAVALVERSR